VTVDRDQTVYRVVDNRPQVGLANAQRCVTGLDSFPHDPERRAELPDFDIQVLCNGGLVERAIRNLSGGGHKAIQRAADEIRRDHADQRQCQYERGSQQDQGPGLAKESGRGRVREKHGKLARVRRIVRDTAG